MNNLIWSIYKVVGEPAEGTELYRMLQVHPQAGTHNSTNYIFVSSLEDAVNPIVVSELLDEAGEKVAGDKLVWVVAKELVKSVRPRAIHLTKGEAITLSAHPAWRIWCGEYGEDRELFELDWAYLGGMLAELKPSAIDGWPVYNDSATYPQAREVLRTAINLNS